MRTHALVSIAAISLLAACSDGRAQDANASPSPSPSASPAPLRSCETRELQLEGSDVVVQANLDQTVGAVVVLRAPDAQTRERAYDDAIKTFGEPHPDKRTAARPSKWGLITVTDLCGRPTSPAPNPSP